MELEDLLQSTDLAPMGEAIAGACAPLSGAAPEEDPRYLDGFVEIKQEIDKLHGADLSAVVKDALAFLAQTAKDLRIAGYLSLALVARFGAPGLMSAAIIYRALVEREWDQLHPRKPSQRSAAVAWLNGPRMKALLDGQRAELQASQWAALAENLEALQVLLAERLPAASADVPAGWLLASRWLEDMRPQASEAPDAAQSQAANQSGAAKAVVLPQAEVDDALPQEQLHDHVRVLHEALLTQGQRLQAYGMAVAARWGGLKEPPSEAGVTRIPPPRSAAWNEIDALEQADVAEAYGAASRLIFEAGFQWSLDLQQRLAGLASALGDEALQAQIRGQTQLLLERIPGIAALHYADGSPFAGEAARTWIQGLQSQSLAVTAADSPQEDFEQLARMAREEKDLTRAFALLDASPAVSARQRCRIDLLRAELCLGAKRAHVAYGLLMELKRRVEGMQVMDWDPEVSTQLYESLRRAAIALKTSQGNGKTGQASGLHPGLVVEECERLIAGLNPARALQLV